MQKNSRIISAAQAIAMGWTPGQLRVIANSLERIAKKNKPDTISYVKNQFGDVTEGSFYSSNFNPSLNRQNAQRFRHLALEVEKMQRKAQKSRSVVDDVVRRNVEAQEA